MKFACKKCCEFVWTDQVGWILLKFRPVDYWCLSGWITGDCQMRYTLLNLSLDFVVNHLAWACHNINYYSIHFNEAHCGHCKIPQLRTTKNIFALDLTLCHCEGNQGMACLTESAYLVSIHVPQLSQLKHISSYY